MNVYYIYVLLRSDWARRSIWMFMRIGFLCTTESHRYFSVVGHVGHELPARLMEYRSILKSRKTDQNKTKQVKRLEVEQILEDSTSNKKEPFLETLYLIDASGKGLAFHKQKKMVFMFLQTKKISCRLHIPLLLCIATDDPRRWTPGQCLAWILQLDQ